jgi:hypothetical protein
MQAIVLTALWPLLTWSCVLISLYCTSTAQTAVLRSFTLSVFHHLHLGHSYECTSSRTSLLNPRTVPSTAAYTLESIDTQPKPQCLRILPFKRESQPQLILQQNLQEAQTSHQTEAIATPCQSLPQQSPDARCTASNHIRQYAKTQQVATSYRESIES